jgi:hypothetical protein
MKAALLAALLLGAAGPAWAHTHHFSAGAGHADWATPSAITCETVRNYVSMVGLTQARAMARANGMTDDQERRARRCLARSD